MPSGVSTYASGRWLQFVFGIGSQPANYWVGLATAAPLASFDGLSMAQYEPDDPAYARQVQGLGPAWWVLGGDGMLTNTADIAFPAPGVDWGFITHAVLCDQALAGNLYCWGEIRNPQKIVQGVAPIIPAGSLVMSMPTG
jgi:hypothetical protein